MVEQALVRLYKLRLLLMVLAFIQILPGVFWIFGKKVGIFYLGTVGVEMPLLLVVAPFVGLALGYVDVRLSTMLFNSVSSVRRELLIPHIKALVEPYVDAPSRSFMKISLYAAGEEAIRGMFLWLLVSRLEFVVAILLVSVMFSFARPIPLFAKLPKFIDDLVLTLLFYWVGFVGAWLAHVALNSFVLRPLWRR